LFGKPLPLAFAQMGNGFDANGELDKVKCHGANIAMPAAA
jgi:hypothetical protein